MEVIWTSCPPEIHIHCRPRESWGCCVDCTGARSLYRTRHWPICRYRWRQKRLTLRVSTSSKDGASRYRFFGDDGAARGSFDRIKRAEKEGLGVGCSLRIATWEVSDHTGYDRCPVVRDGLDPLVEYSRTRSPTVVHMTVSTHLHHTLVTKTSSDQAFGDRTFPFVRGSICGGLRRRRGHDTALASQDWH